MAAKVNTVDHKAIISAKFDKAWDHIVKLQKHHMMPSSHKIHTPRVITKKLVKEILKNTDTTNNILVLYNVEFILELLEQNRLMGANTSQENITFLSDDKEKTDFVKKMGVKVITELPTNEKFDIVIGNPPYTDGTHGKATIWDKFIEKAMSMSNTVAFVVPSSLAQSNNYRSLRRRINDNGLGAVEFLPSETFPDVTVETLYFVTASNAKPYDGDVWFKPKLKSIIEKIEMVAGTEYYNKNSMLRFKSVKLTGEVGSVIANISRHGHKIEEGKLDRDRDNHRVVTSYMSNAKCHLQAVETTLPGTGIPGSYRQMIVSSDTEANNIRTYLKSNFCVALYELTKTSRSIDGPQTRFIPMMDFTREWTSADIYNHFGLTAEEIAYLEENV